MSTLSKNQFLLIAHDFTDTEAFSRRLASRPTHVARAAQLGKEGSFITGGAILSETDLVEGKPKMWAGYLFLVSVIRDGG